MPSKKKSRNNDQKKTKNKNAKVTARSEQKSIKPRSGKRSTARKATKTKNSKRSTAPRNRSQVDAMSDIERETRNQGMTSARRAIPQSDFQGLSRAEEADSESVDELVEEGNVLESGAVGGVQKAEDEDEREVHTHQLPEDDVPDEYLENE